MTVPLSSRRAAGVLGHDFKKMGLRGDQIDHATYGNCSHPFPRTFHAVRSRSSHICLQNCIFATLHWKCDRPEVLGPKSAALWQRLQCCVTQVASGQVLDVRVPIRPGPMMLRANPCSCCVPDKDCTSQTTFSVQGRQLRP